MGSVFSTSVTADNFEPHVADESCFVCGKSVQSQKSYLRRQYGRCDFQHEPVKKTKQVGILVGNAIKMVLQVLSKQADLFWEELLYALSEDQVETLAYYIGK